MTDYLSEPHSYRRKLPHIQPVNATYFVTYRLANSIPKSTLIELQIKKENFERQLQSIKSPVEREKLKNEFHKIYFKNYDDILDKIQSGPSWLNDPGIALIVSKSIKHYDGRGYDLLAYTIMPNHVHQVFHLSEDHLNNMIKTNSRKKRNHIRLPGF